MKRTIAAAGLVGLGLLGATLPASANNGQADGMVSICHETGSGSNPTVDLTVNENGLNGHADGNSGPGNNNGNGNSGPGGGHDDGECSTDDGGNEQPPNEEPPAEQPPNEEPPAEQPPNEEPPAEQPPNEEAPNQEAVTPPVVTPNTPVVKPVVKPIAKPAVKPAVKPVTKPAAKPAVAAPAVQPAPAAAALVPVADNAGLNVQTAASAGSEPGAGIPGWLAAMTGLFTALAAGVLARSGIRSRKPEA